MIERSAGNYSGRSKSSAYKELVFSVATSPKLGVGTYEQTALTLKVIEDNLKELSSDKSKILSAQVYIARMGDKPEMDRAWCEWIGNDSANWPQRACLGVALEGAVLVEIAVTAVREYGT